MKTCNCPGCGAEIRYDENRDFIFCQECGTKVVFGLRVTDGSFARTATKEACKHCILKSVISSFQVVGFFILIIFLYHAI